MSILKSLSFSHYPSNVFINDSMQVWLHINSFFNTKYVNDKMDVFVYCLSFLRLIGIHELHTSDKIWRRNIRRLLHLVFGLWTVVPQAIVTIILKFVSYKITLICVSDNIHPRRAYFLH